jgi:hypothetical protein
VLVSGAVPMSVWRAASSGASPIRADLVAVDLLPSEHFPDHFVS